MELLGDTVIILASQVITNDSLCSEQIMFVNHLNISWQVVFFLVGWIFFVKMLFRDYELHHNLVQLIFCVNFRYLSWLDPNLIIFYKETFQLILHNVWAYNIRDCQLSGQKFKVKWLNVIVTVLRILNLFQVFPLVLCHILHAVHGDR